MQSIRRSLSVREVASSSPVSSNAVVKIQRAWVPLDKELADGLEELIPAAMVDYDLKKG